jgi:hypothetical protein
MQDATRLAEAAWGMALAGETARAGAMMQQARFIISTSDDIANDKELDKLLSPKAVQLYGAKVGDTMRDVLGKMPPSIEKQAEIQARGRQRGKKSVDAIEQIGFIDEANLMMSDLMAEIKIDPNIVGILGSIRAGGQTLTGVLGDVGLGKMVDTAKDIIFTDTEAGPDHVFEWFDSPTLSNLKVLENSIGLIFARLRNKSGRVPVEVIRLSIGDVKLSGLTSSTQVQNRLNFLSKQLDRRKARLEKQFDLGGEGEEQLNADVPKWKMVDGKLVPVGGAPEKKAAPATAKKEAPATAKNFPKVTKPQQKKRDLKRKGILEDELALENSLLEKASEEDKELHLRNIKAIEKELKE